MTIPDLENLNSLGFREKNFAHVHVHVMASAGAAKRKQLVKKGIDIVVENENPKKGSRWGVERVGGAWSVLEGVLEVCLNCA